VNADELRSVQAPIKAGYREDPTSAVLKLSAKGVLGEEAISCKVDTGRGLAEAGLHPAAGGDGSWACSGDMLLEALVACAGVTLKAVATAMGIEVTRGSVLAEGEIDFRGTLGVDKAVPVGFRSIHLAFEVESSADKDQIDKLLSLTERYCVIYQTLREPAALSTSIEVAPAE
jgi:uncharacterized OsmC-like protein